MRNSWDMLARNCDFSAEACSSCDGLAAQQLVLTHQLGGGLADLPFQLPPEACELLVRALALEGLRCGRGGWSRRRRAPRRCSLRIWPDTASTGTGSRRLHVHEVDAAAKAHLGHGRENTLETNEVKVGVVGPHPLELVRAGAG